ncbi:hypothetical protein KEM55_002943 [Ascosphaera atra]|nr:hypothetical protein KEM55_002943 [Ascosphaera atra]
MASDHKPNAYSPMEKPSPGLQGYESSYMRDGGISPPDLEATLSKEEEARASSIAELDIKQEIDYRTCSWQKVSTGVPGRHEIRNMTYPEVRDVCDIAGYLFGNSKIVYVLTAAMFLLNNTFIMVSIGVTHCNMPHWTTVSANAKMQGLHCLVGAEYLNTMTNHATCTIVFSIVTAIVSYFFTLPRTLRGLSHLGVASAIFTFVSVLTATIFSAIEPHPANYPSQGEPKFLLWPAKGTTFVSGMNAFMNISYTFVGQITLPSFIAEMKNPRDFPKSLWAVTICEVILFGVVGSVIYAYTGTQYMTSPAFGAISNTVYKKISFSFMVPTLVFLGVLYASVSARFIFFRIFHNSKHKNAHSVKAWSTWCAILAVLWVLAFIVAEVIPFFSDLLSIMSSCFDSFFGFIFWGVAYMRLHKEKYGPGFYKNRGFKGWFGFVLNIVIILIGFFFLGPGTYVSYHWTADCSRALLTSPFLAGIGKSRRQQLSGRPIRLTILVRRQRHITSLRGRRKNITSLG